MDLFFWQKKVWGCDRAESETIMDVLKKDAQGFRVERVVKDKQGRKHVFMDQAIPFWDESGDLRWFEGIMVDITELNRALSSAETSTI